MLVAVALGSLGLAWALLEGVIRRSAWGAAVTFLYVAIEHSGALPPALFEAGVAVSPSDVIAALLAAAAVARFLRMRRLTRWHRLLFLLIALAVFALLRGVVAIGVQPAANEARVWVWFLATAAYFSTVMPSRAQLDRIGRYWIWAGATVMVIAFLRWGALLAGLPQVGILAYEGGDLRVIRARESLLMVQAALIALPTWCSVTNARYRWVGVALLSTVVLMQHRTLWVALLAGLIVMMRRDPVLARRVGAFMIGAVAVGALLFTAVLGGQTDDLSASATSTDTFSWRFEGWTSLFVESGPRSATEVAVGRPFGSGFERIADGLSRTERPHSQYIESFLRVGAVGVVVLTGLTVGLAWRLWRRPKRPDGAALVGPDALLYMLVVQVLFSITYHVEFSGGIVLGLAVAFMSWPHAYEQPEHAGDLSAHPQLSPHDAPT